MILYELLNKSNRLSVILQSLRVEFVSSNDISIKRC